MSKKLFVGNLSWGMSQEDLHNLFAEFGQVSEAIIITDRETGRSKGFGFVTFENDQEATTAEEALNGKEISGREIVVNEARPQEKRF